MVGPGIGIRLRKQSLIPQLLLTSPIIERPVPRPKSVKALRSAIRELTPDRPRHYPRKNWSSQHEHWLGWLKDYNGPGYYNRKGRRTDAAFAYNHINEPDMLLWRAKAAGVSRTRLERAKREARIASSEPGGASAVRRSIPWEVVRDALWD